MAAYHTTMMADFFVLIQLIRALNEWSSGEFVDLTSLDSASLIHYGDIEQRLKAVLSTFKQSRNDAWINFGAKVVSATGSDVTVNTAALTEAVLSISFMSSK